MSFSESLANRIRSAIRPIESSFEEKRMFGGLSFMYKGKMSIGIVKEDLCVRIIEEKHQDLLVAPGTRPMDFTGKPMKDMLYVSQDVLESEEELMKWINIGIEHAESKLK